MHTILLLIILSHFPSQSYSECKFLYVTKDGTIKNPGCFNWKAWSAWSECNANGIKQRKRQCLETLKEDIGFQPCFPKFHSTFRFLNDKTPPGGPRTQLPKTKAAALLQNYKMISDCSTTSKTNPGQRYISPLKDKIVIFDVNGIIAGMHSIFPKSAAKATIDYTTLGYYREVTIDSIQYYMTTAYFIEPSTICSTGRTETQLKSQGTLSKLYFQNGQTIEQLLKAPLLENEAQFQWYQQKCFPNMGIHYNKANIKSSTLCDGTGIPPFQLIYHQGILRAFQWLHAFDLSKARPQDITEDNWTKKQHPWEKLDEFAIRVILKDPPTCLFGSTGLLEQPGIISQHVYFRDWKAINC